MKKTKDETYEIVVGILSDLILKNIEAKAKDSQELK